MRLLISLSPQSSINTLQYHSFWEVYSITGLGGLMKEILGAFAATNGNRQRRVVVVCQESVLDENDLIVGSRKVFRLDAADGEEVFATEDPEVYLHRDGSLVKKIGSVKTGDIEQVLSRDSHRRR